MKKLGYFFAIPALCFAASPAMETLTLQQAMRVAMARPAVEDLDLQVAQTRVHLLEAASHRKLDWIPTVGLFAMTNPVALVTNIGSRLLLRSSDVPPTALFGAKIAEMEAVLARRRLDFQREVGVTRAFFSTAERQRINEQTCAAVNETVALRPQTEQRSQAWVTRLDALRQEQDALNREAACSQSTRDLSISNAYLSRWVGVAGDEIRVEERVARLPALDATLEQPAALFRVALSNRAEPSQLRESVRQLRKQLDRIRPPKPFNLSLGYSRLGNDGFRGLNSTMFTGQGFQPEISLQLPLKRNSAFAFELQLLALQLSKLERELDDMETEVRAQIAELRAQFESRRGELVMARKRQSVAVELAKCIKERYSAGLETAAALASVREAESQSRVVLARLEYESKTALAVLLTICGLGDHPAGGVDLIVAHAQTQPSALAMD
jgi:hypothetical protein